MTEGSRSLTHILKTTVRARTSAGDGGCGIFAVKRERAGMRERNVRVG